MVIVVGNGYGSTSSNLDETVRISHSADKLKKSMNPAILAQLWINSPADWTFRRWCGKLYGIRITQNSKPKKTPLKKVNLYETLFVHYGWEMNLFSTEK